MASAEERLREPAHVVELGYGRAEALREASRCLDCGVTPVFDGNRCVLCGGCVDVCPTQCLKLVPLADLAASDDLDAAIRAGLASRGRESFSGMVVPMWHELRPKTTPDPVSADDDLENNSAILKDEDRCIRCALCAQRCPVDAITMERVTCSTSWRSA